MRRRHPGRICHSRPRDAGETPRRRLPAVIGSTLPCSFADVASFDASFARTPSGGGCDQRGSCRFWQSHSLTTSLVSAHGRTLDIGRRCTGNNLDLCHSVGARRRRQSIMEAPCPRCCFWYHATVPRHSQRRQTTVASVSSRHAVPCQHVYAPASVKSVRVMDGDRGAEGVANQLSVTSAPHRCDAGLSLFLAVAL